MKKKHNRTGVLSKIQLLVRKIELAFDPDDAINAIETAFEEAHKRKGDFFDNVVDEMEKQLLK